MQYTCLQIDSGTKYTLLSYLNTIKRAVHVLSQLFIAGLELKNSIAHKTWNRSCARFQAAF